MHKIISHLEDLGLTHKEALVYFTLLSKGPMTGTEISKILKDAPSIIYRVLHRLERKGFVFRVRNKPAIFKARSPDICTAMLVEEKEMEYKRLSDVRNSFLKIFDLYVRSSSDEDTGFEIVEGATFVMRTIREMILRAEKEILNFVNTDGLDRMYQWHRYYYNMAASKGIKLRIITSKVENSDAFEFLSRIAEIRYFNVIKLRFVIRDRDEIILITENINRTGSKYIGVYSRNSNTIDTFTNIFDFIWNNSK